MLCPRVLIALVAPVVWFRYIFCEPRLQRLHRILKCAMLRSNWSALPQLMYIPRTDYTVAIHIRTGDIRLHADAPGYFQREQLDFYLGGFQVHYMFAEDPEKG
jgi:hypothetical protein